MLQKFLKNKYLYVCVFLIFSILLLVMINPQKKVNKKRKRARITIETTRLSPRSFEVSKDYIGTFYPAGKFAVHSKVGGRLIHVRYNLGDPVQNGAVIAELDDVIIGLELKQAERKLQAEQSKVSQKQMSIDLAQKEYTRMIALRDEKVVSESSLEKAQYDFEQKKLTLDADRAGLKMQETAVEMARLRLSYTDIAAQWTQGTDSGTRIVAERFVDEGAMVTPNTPIVSIIEIGTLFVEIFVGEREYPQFESGMKVWIDLDAFPGRKFEGRVARVAPFINESTRQAKVQIEVENPDLELRPGMFARTSVVFDMRKDVPMLPAVCIAKEKNVRGVFMYDETDETVHFLPVSVGMIRDGYAEILNFTEVNSPVVIVGQHMLRDGDKVMLYQPEEVQPAGETRP